MCRQPYHEGAASRQTAPGAHAGGRSTRRCSGRTPNAATRYLVSRRRARPSSGAGSARDRSQGDVAALRPTFQGSQLPSCRRWSQCRQTPPGPAGCTDSSWRTSLRGAPRVRRRAQTRRCPGALRVALDATRAPTISARCHREFSVDFQAGLLILKLTEVANVTDVVASAKGRSRPHAPASPFKAGNISPQCGADRGGLQRGD